MFAQSVLNYIYQRRNSALPLTVKLCRVFILKRENLDNLMLCTKNSDSVSHLAARKGQALALGCLERQTPVAFIHPSQPILEWTGVQALLTEARRKDDGQRVCTCFFTGVGIPLP